MIQKPLVTVIIIFLNAERFIAEAIESVFAHTYRDWELLLVDDGSTDTSTAIARQYAQQYPDRVRYLEHEGHRNRDMPATRNVGIRNARGPYLAFLDADDVWLPHKLEQQVAILESHPEAAMVYGLDQYWYSWTGHPNDLQRDYVHQLGVEPHVLLMPPTLVRLFLQGKAVVPCPTGILVRRSAVERVGGFEEAFRGFYHIYEDQAFYAKLLLEQPAIAVDECWDRYRQHPDASCAIAQRTGQQTAARLFYLSWLAGYLRRQGVNDPELLSALRDKWLKFRYPRVYHLLSGARYRAGRLRARLGNARGALGTVAPVARRADERVGGE